MTIRSPHPSEFRARSVPSHRTWRPGSTRGVGLFLSVLVAVATICGLWFISSRVPARTPNTQKPIEIAPAPTSDDDLSGSGITLQLVDRDNPGRLAAELNLPAVQPLAAKRYAVDSPSGWVYPRDGRVLHIRADKGDMFLPNRQQLPERGEFKGNVVVRLFSGPASRTIDPESEIPLLVARTDTIAFDGAIGELQVPGRIAIEGSGIDYAGRSLRVLFNDPEQRIELLTAEQSEHLTIDPRRARTAPSLFEGRGGSTLASSPPALTSPPATTPDASPASTASTASTAPAAALNIPNPAARDQMYRVRVENDVRVVQAARTIDAAVAEIFTREIRSPTPTTTTTLSTLTAQDVEGLPSVAQSTPAQATHQSAASPSTPLQSPTATLPSSDAPVTITWLGRLELRPLAAGSVASPVPEVLTNNNLAAVFTGGKDAAARVVDTGADLAASGDIITYLDTRREARVWSDPSRPLASVLTAKGRGRVLASAASMNLATGLATFVGPGRMENTDSEVATPLPSRGEAPPPSSSSSSRSIAWNESALLRFLPDDRGDPKVLESAYFQGSVVATGGGAHITADSVEARFEAAPTSSLAASEQPILSVVSLRGNAKGADSKDGTLAAHAIEVRFSAPPPNSANKDAVAQKLIATGNVTASSKGSTLHADALDASLTTEAAANQDADSSATNVAVSLATARGSVRFSRADGTRAESEELVADVPNQQAELAGPVVILGKGDSRVTGERMRLDGTTGRLEVVGPGVFQHEGTSSEGTPRLASARWTGVDSGMVYEDSTGILEAHAPHPHGRAVAEAMPDERTIDRLEANFVRVLLTPTATNSSSPTPAATDAPIDALTADREVLSVLATSIAPFSEPSSIINPVANSSSPAVVKVESRRYSASITDLDEDHKRPPLERLVYLESTRVEADNAKGTLFVPVAGKMFVLAGKDARSADSSTTASDSPPSSAQQRAAALSANLSPSSDSSRLDRSRTLFRWDGTMTMTRGGGTGTPIADAPNSAPSVRTASPDEHTMTMDGGVQLTSEREADKQLTQLDCQQLSAWLTPSQTDAAPGDSPDANAIRGELSRALAQGTARLKSGTRTLLGDLIDYNPANGTAMAGSRDNSTVTLIDDETATPITARGILWDMQRGRVEVKNVSTVVAPR